MAFNEHLADRVREYLFENCHLPIEEKAMFGGIAFLVDGKMCINISGDNLMCRFDPLKTEVLIEKRGAHVMLMKGRVLDGYCYVDSDGYKDKDNFEFWIHECLDFNPIAQASKKTNKSPKH